MIQFQGFKMENCKFKTNKNKQAKEQNAYMIRCFKKTKKTKNINTANPDLQPLVGTLNLSHFREQQHEDERQMTYEKDANEY